ncbi:MAG: AIR synthase family protein [Atribacterota bacterium]
MKHLYQYLAPPESGKKMKLGKICPEKLQRLVFPYQGKVRPEILYNASLGRDCGIADLGGDLLAATCDPITGTSSHLGFFAVNVVANDLICGGAEPVAILVSLILPPDTPDTHIEEIMKEIDEECQKLQISVLGGHTELSDAVNRTIIHCSGIGRAQKGNLPDVEKVRPGDSIVITKGAGIEGTAILAHSHQESLQKKYGDFFVTRSQDFLRFLSVVPEGKIALPFQPHCLHDATEGGLLGALWEVCEGQKLGFEIEESAIFIPPETRELCDFFGMDPLKLISSGTLIIFTDEPEPVMAHLTQAGIPSFQIGTIAREKDKIIKKPHGTRETITECPQDELWR